MTVCISKTKFLATTALVALAASGAHAAADVTGVRFGVHDDKTRLVLDMTAAADYEIKAKPDGSEIEIILTGTDWGNGISDIGHGKGLVDGYMRLDEGKGNTHIFVTMAEPAEVTKSFTLKGGKKGDAAFRLVVDIADSAPIVAEPTPEPIAESFSSADTAPEQPAPMAQPKAPVQTAALQAPRPKAKWAPVDENVVAAAAANPAPRPKIKPRPLRNVATTACQKFQKRVSPFTGRDPEAMFLWAECAREKGELAQAAKYYRETLKLNPDAQRARLELGEVLFEMREHGASKDVFAQVLETDPPKVVAANIKAKMVEVERHEKGIDPPKDYNARLRLGLLHDTNVNGGSAGGTVDLFGVPFTLDEASTAQETYGYMLSLEGHGTLHREDELVFDINGGLTTNEYRKYGQYETTTMYGRFAGRHTFGTRYSVGVPLMLQKAWLGGKSYSTTTTLEPDARMVLEDGTVVSVSMPVQWTSYDTSQTKDGRSYGGTISAAIPMSDNWIIRPKFAGSSFDAKSNEESYDSYAASVLLRGKLSQRLTGYATGLRGTNRYNAVSSTYGVQRVDDKSQLGFGLSYDLRDTVEGLSAGLNYTFIDNESTVTVNDYDRHQTMMTVTKKF